MIRHSQGIRQLHAEIPVLRVVKQGRAEILYGNFRPIVLELFITALEPLHAERGTPAVVSLAIRVGKRRKNNGNHNQNADQQGLADPEIARQKIRCRRCRHVLPFSKPSESLQRESTPQTS